MNLVEQILLEGKERRAAAKTRSELIEAFRRDAKRSIPSAIMYLVVAIPQGALLYLYSIRHREFTSWSVLEGIFICGTLCFSLSMCIRSLWVSPRDKLLLLLLDEALPKTEPNKAPEPTTMAVTIRAPSSTARASHGRGSS